MNHETYDGLPASSPVLAMFKCVIDALERNPRAVILACVLMIALLLLAHHHLNVAGLPIQLPPLMVIPLTALACVVRPRQMLVMIMMCALLWAWMFGRDHLQQPLWVMPINILTLLMGLGWMSLLVMTLKSMLSREIQSSQRDPLTQMFNLQAFESLAPSRQRWCCEQQLPLTLVFIDLDYFKQLNDRWGHQIGNQVLIALSHSLRAALPRHGLCARFGGDEFVVLLPDHGRLEAVARLEAVRNHFERWLEPLEVHATLSMGGVSFDWTVAAQPLVRLVSQADQQMYQVKSTGRNRICISESAGAAASVAA